MYPDPGMAEDAAPSPAPISLPPEVQARVFRVIERLAVSSDLQELIGLIIDSLRDCLAAERATVFQYDEKSQELFISQAHGFAGVRFPITRGIAGEAARTRAIINVPDAWQDPRFNPEFDKKSGFRTRGLLTIPMLSFDGKLQGVAQVLNKDPALGPVFDDADELVA
ncbi:MAG: GAF domain-containing protein, partial [Phycisphaerae bacterium]|nr:GAF domain-containing protein [Phycisphaerae bacterium]